MRIIVNGEERTLSDGLTVRQLLAEMQLDRAVCAVELNRNVLPRDEHDARQLHDGDRIEVVTLVGGG